MALMAPKMLDAVLVEPEPLLVLLVPVELPPAKRRREIMTAVARRGGVPLGLLLLPACPPLSQAGGCRTSEHFASRILACAVTP